MLSFIAHAGYATTIVDFTNELSSLLVGLIALTALSAGMIAFEAVRYHFAQKAEVPTETAPAISEWRQAA